MKILIIIFLLVGCNVLLVAQPSMDKYYTSIRIEWGLDSNSSDYYIKDSLEYGFLGFYESSNFRSDSVLKFIKDSLNCPVDSLEDLVLAVMSDFKPMFFCESFQSNNHPNLSIGYYSIFDGTGILSQGNQIDFFSTLAYRNSENDFLLCFIMRIKLSSDYKLIILRDNGGPQRYHIKFKLDSFNFKIMPEVSYFDLVDKKSEYYPSKIYADSESIFTNQIFYKTLYSISNHKSSLIEIEKILFKSHKKE